MKSIRLACLFIALFAYAYAANQTWGARKNTDSLLHRELVFRNATAGSFSSVEVKFPKSGQINNFTITAINITDRIPNNRGATADLWSGGVGYRFLSLNFKSQFAQPINSTLEIYGKK